MFDNSQNPVSLRVQSIKQAVGNSTPENIKEILQLANIQDHSENPETILAWDAGWYQFNQHNNY